MAINQLSLLILVPLIIAVLNLFLPVILRKILAALGLVWLLILNYQLFMNPVAEIVIQGVAVLAVDKLALAILSFIQILAVVILIFSLKGVNPKIQKPYYVLYPLTLAFCNGAVLSVQALSLLIFWGLSGIALYLFTLLGDEKTTPETAKKTFIIVGGSDVFLILGLVLIWFLMPLNGGALWNLKIGLSGELAYTAFFALLIAAFAKGGGFPLHSWVPDYSKDAPVEAVAFLPASLDKLLGIYLFVRIVWSLFALNFRIHLFLMTIGALTIIFAVMMAMIQHNGRKLLGYHAVSQVGYMILGIGSGSIIALIGGLFHLINNTIYKSNLFLALGSVEKKTGTNELEELGGLGGKMPLTFGFALVGALAISGIPPFNGFFSKWMIYQGLLDLAAGLAPGYQIWVLVCLVLAVFGSALTLASFMKFIHAIFLGRRPAKWDNISRAPLNQWLATGILATLCVIFGLWAIHLPITKLILPVIGEFGFSVPQMLGYYNPILVVLLFGVTLVLGLIIYWGVRKVRFDEIYLGGMNAVEHFRVLGTEFYKEIRDMKPLKAIYNGAEKKYFDIYDVSGRCSFAITRLFRAIHNGQLQLYNLWIVLGMLILLWVVL